MILTVTPNPAIDTTYTTARLDVGGVNRVRATFAPGGKGVNVSRVLARLDVPSTCTGFLGGDPGRRLRVLLVDATLVGQAWVDVEGETRTTVGVVEDDGTATMLNEPGPTVTRADWDRLRGRAQDLLGPGDVLVISGSLPPGTEHCDVPALVVAAHARGARTIVDTTGPGLLAAASAGATILKPNHHELLDATGAPDVAAGAAQLLMLGAGAVVVSRGAAGVTAYVPADGSAVAELHARPAEVLTGNPTGAGDAAVAALARGLAAHPGALLTMLRTHLADVVALSAAAVLAPVAGDVDLPTYARTRALVTVQENHAARPARTARPHPA